jgi:hypothetical protein
MVAQPMNARWTSDAKIRNVQQAIVQSAQYLSQLKLSVICVSDHTQLKHTQRSYHA